MSTECCSLPSCLLKANLPINTWEALKGKGLPDSSSNEWFAIVSLFEKSTVQRNDKREIADFLGAKLKLFSDRLHTELRRRNGGKLPDGARIYKEKRQKIMASIPFGATPTTFAVGDAAAAEGSSPRPDGAAVGEACGGGAQGPSAPPPSDASFPGGVPPSRMAPSSGAPLGACPVAPALAAGPPPV